MNKQNLSIGTLSKATGIPINTIRTWEKRYGFPPSMRTEGNHRIYSSELIEHMNMISLALQNGFRAGQIVGMDLQKIKKIVSEIQRSLRQEPNILNEVDEWLQACKELDEQKLEAGFKSAQIRLGLYQFILQCVAPFLQQLGELWRRGEIRVFQEHFATERLQNYLFDSWQYVAGNSKGPVMICAVLPGENHILGLHMAAAITALQGYQIVFLGGNIPVLEIVDCCAQRGAQGVIISISSASNQALMLKSLTELRRHLPDQKSLLVGGMGAPTMDENIVCFQELEQFSFWLSERKLLS